MRNACCYPLIDSLFCRVTAHTSASCGAATGFCPLTAHTSASCDAATGFCPATAHTSASCGAATGSCPLTAHTSASAALQPGFVRLWPTYPRVRRCNRVLSGYGSHIRECDAATGFCPLTADTSASCDAATRFCPLTAHTSASCGAATGSCPATANRRCARHALWQRHAPGLNPRFCLVLPVAAISPIPALGRSIPPARHLRARTAIPAA